LSLLGLAYRIWRYGKQQRETGKLPVIDPFQRHFKAEPTNGVPIGGIGAGSINRGWRGEFARWQLQPGFALIDPVPVDLFSVQIDKPFDAFSFAPEYRSSFVPSGPDPSLSPNSLNVPRTRHRRNSFSGEKNMFRRKPKACVLHPDGKYLRTSALKEWNFGLTGSQSTYYALFPRAWTVYNEPDPTIRLTCKQFSPVIPNNYKV
jgi:non-lysosomal glucosylceramidase